MTRTSQVLAVAVPFVWLGMVLAISFIETPLKFRVPGISLPLGLGIGRLVFRALNMVEIGLLGLLAAAAAAGSTPPPGWGLLAGLAAMLAVQVLVLRPFLDRRAVQLIAGQPPAPSHTHLVYIALEAVKVIALPVLGVVLACGPEHDRRIWEQGAA